MIEATLIGGGILLGTALLGDPTSTVKAITGIIAVRGVTFVCKKIANMNTDYEQIIDFTGWGLAGIGIVTLIKNSLKGISPVIHTVQGAVDFFSQIGAWLDKIPFIN
jgi:hypothetical protein